MRHGLIGMLVAALLLAVIGAALAAPLQMNYQGFLRDSAGEAVTDSVNLQFYIFPDSGAMTACWGPESWFDHPVVDGLFELQLGSRVPLNESCFDGSVKWLEVWVNGSPLAPRKPISSVAYAIASSTGSGGDVQSVTAGAGLVGIDEGGPDVTLSVGAGPGILVEANQVSLDASMLDLPIGAIIDYGGNLSGGTERELRDLKVCYGRAFISSENRVTISGLPFSSATSYQVLLTRNNPDGYTSQALTARILSGSAFEILDFTYNTTICWIAIGI